MLAIGFDSLNGCRAAAARTLFLASSGLVVESPQAAPAKATSRGPLRCDNRGDLRGRPRRAAAAVDSAAVRCPSSGKHGRHRGVDRHVGRVQDRGVGGGHERCYRPFPVARVAIPDIAQKTLNININSFFRQLPVTPGRPLLGGGGHEDLHRRVRQTRPCPCRAPRRPGRAAAGTPAGGRGAPCARPGWTATREAAAETASSRTASVTSAPVQPEPVRRRRRNRSDRASAASASASSAIGCRLERLQRDQPVQRAAIQVVPAERIGDALGDRALARRRRPVDRDDRDVAQPWTYPPTPVSWPKHGEVLGKRLADAPGVADRDRDARRTRRARSTSPSGDRRRCRSRRRREACAAE